MFLGSGDDDGTGTYPREDGDGLGKEERKATSQWLGGNYSSITAACQGRGAASDLLGEGGMADIFSLKKHQLHSGRDIADRHFGLL